MSKILITGGAGFIGSNTIKSLIEKGNEIITIDDFNDYYDPSLKEARIKNFLKKYKFKLYRGDIRNIEFLKKIFKQEKIKKICHLAARAGVRASIENPILYEEVNIKGTLNMLECAKENNIENFVFASSSSVYGANKKFPFSEKDEVENQISHYGATKRCGEILIKTYSNMYKIPSTCLRYFTVYGPWGRPDMAIFLFTKAILEGKKIKVFNKGKMKRDFTYIDDIVSGTIKALEKNSNFEIINLGNNKRVDLEYLISCIEKETGKKAKKEYMEMQKGDLKETYADIKKAKKILNFSPKTSIEKGIKNFVEWYKKYTKDEKR